MSSSPTGPTSTTSSSTGSRSRPDERRGLSLLRHERESPSATSQTERRGLSLLRHELEGTSETSQTRVAVIACGAIAAPVIDVVARRGWPVDVHPLPPLLHNQPQRIAVAVEELLDRIAPAYGEVVVGYADCGTYGALDELCRRRGLRRLTGLHCYDVYAGADRVRELFEAQPGTYVLTDFLVRSFARTVLAELGLDRHPELLEDYFGHYTRVVWLAQSPDDELRVLARDAAARISLPLQEVRVGDAGLERELATLLALP